MSSSDQPCLLIISGSERRNSFSESSIASSDEGNTLAGRRFPRPCPTCKKGWIDAGNLTPIEECAQSPPPPPRTSLWKKVPRVTWLSRSVNSPATHPPCPDYCPARASQGHLPPESAHLHFPGDRPTLKKSASSATHRSILSQASSHDVTTLSSARYPRSVKFSEEASVLYYDYDMMFNESSDDLDPRARVTVKVKVKTNAVGVLHRIVRWVRRVGSRRKKMKEFKDKTQGDPRSLPVISGPYRLWDAAASVEYAVSRRQRDHPDSRPSLTNMWKEGGCAT